ncbi:MAG TPA: hypothetical protein VGH27_01570 [Streptosporangiaceae bacterium]|jgi:hypothetical protein
MTGTYNLLDVAGRIEDHAGVLGVALAAWSRRDDTRAQPRTREAASTAMEAIDAMLAQLHAARAVLVTEIRRSDDAAMARTEQLLDECGGGVA